MKLVYEESGIQLYQGDALKFPIPANSAVITAPPYYEDPHTATTFIELCVAEHLIFQWDRFSKPHAAPIGEPDLILPLAAIHVWAHKPPSHHEYQAFYHATRDPAAKVQSRIFRCAADRFATSHPHELPVEVALHLVNLISPTLVIVDPFCGSGSVLEAARVLGRKAIGIEINGDYCDLAIRRLKQL